MLTDKFIDAVMVYTEHKTGIQRTTRSHYKSMDEIVDAVIKWQNPKNNNSTLDRVRIYDFFGDKIKDSYPDYEFALLPRYSEKLEVAKNKWNRSNKIESILK